jgi:hypothetical protein
MLAWNFVVLSTSEAGLTSGSEQERAHEPMGWAVLGGEGVIGHFVPSP